MIANTCRDAGVPMTSMRVVNCGGCSKYLHPQSFDKACHKRLFQAFEQTVRYRKIVVRKLADASLDGL